MPGTSSSFAAIRPPATWTDGTTANGVPMGLHVALDPAYDVSAHSGWTRVFATALQEYGAYLMDTQPLTGGRLSFYAESVYTGSYPSGFNHNAIQAIDWTRVWALTR